jgi:hypothetical protein
LVIFGATFGLCYSALWYFPLLIVAGGIVTVAWDLWLQQRVSSWRARRAEKKRQADTVAVAPDPGAAEEATSQPIELPERTDGKPGPIVGSHENDGGIQRRHAAQASNQAQATQDSAPATVIDSDRTDVQSYAIPVPIGLTIIAVFFGQCHP